MEEKKQSSDGTYVVENKRKVNILAFIGCFLLAFIIWIYVMNVKIYDNTKTFSIKMDIKGESSLLNDKSFSVFGASETWVKVTVQGSNADIQKYSEKDFRVYIDVSNIDNAGMTPLNVVVETPSASVSVISTDPVQTTVFIDEKVSNVKIPVNAIVETQNQETQKHFELNVSDISISGPKSYVNKIAYAQITVDTSRYADVERKYFAYSQIRFFDDADQPIATPYLIYDPNVVTVKEIFPDETTSVTHANITQGTTEN